MDADKFNKELAKLTDHRDKLAAELNSTERTSRWPASASCDCSNKCHRRYSWIYSR